MTKFLTRIKRFVAIALCIVIPWGAFLPSAAAEDDFLLQLFVLAMLDEYGLTDVMDLLSLLDADSVNELYDLYGSYYDDGSVYDNAGEESYPEYLDTRSGFYYGLYTDDTAYITGYDGQLGGFWGRTSLTIPATVDGYPVYDISASAFAGVEGLGSVTISQGIERIDESAFAGSDLQVLILPRSLRSIEYAAFENCPELQEIRFSEGLDYIGISAFANCASLRSVILPDSVTEIDIDAFWNCASLESVHLGTGLSRLHGNVFSLSPRLKKLTLSAQNPVLRLEDGILYNTSAGSIVRYPGAQRTDVVFSVPEGVCRVEDSCFADPNTLEKIILPDSVKVIEDYAFYGCTKCSFFDLGLGLETIGDAAIPTNRLRGIQLPASVQSLQDLSLFSFTEEAYLYDDFWVVAEDGSHAAYWAEQQGYPVYSPTLSALMTIGALPSQWQDGTLPSPVRCFATEGCTWHTAPGSRAAGSVDFNTPVTVTGFASGFAVSAQADGAVQYVPADRLSLLPLQNPEHFGFHRDLTLDGRLLSSIPVENYLYEYYQDVQLWNTYLIEKSAYENSLLDAQALHEALLVELYKTYDEVLESMGPIDMMMDFEALFDFNILASLQRTYTTLSEQLPTMKTMQAFASVLGYENHQQAYTGFTQLFKKLDKIKGMVEENSDLYKSLSPEEKEAISEFFDDIDDMKYIDPIDDFMEDLLEAIGSTQTWKKIKPILQNTAQYTEEVMELLNALLPYLETAIAQAEMKAFFSQLPLRQKEMLKQLDQSDPDSYITLIARHALDFDRWSRHYLDVVRAQAAESVNDLMLSALGSVVSFTTTAGSLYLHLTGTVDNASGAYDQELQRYLAYELARSGAGGVLVSRFQTLPARPGADQLDDLELCVENYVRLNALVNPDFERTSSFISLARESIAHCRAYQDAPAAMPEKPLLFSYQP